MQSDKAKIPNAVKSEKLQAIVQLFGPSVAQKVSGDAHDPSALAEDRITWQQNRLIQHIRDHLPAGAAAEAHASRVEGTHRTGEGDGHLARLALPEDHPDLQREHPAIIAYVLTKAPQSRRVEVLRSLPGQTARKVMRRLREAELRG